MISYCDAIVDLQAGDTGKGKIAKLYADKEDYNLVMRYNGGPNAGHTVYHDGIKVVTHQIPVGVFHGIPSLIGPGCVVSIDLLREEILELERSGIYVENNLMIDKRAHLILPDHIQRDSGDVKIGTTRRGVGPAYTDKYARVGPRAESITPLPDDKFSIIDFYQYARENDLKILCEGAQGFELDIIWGDYPYVTSSHCTIGSVCLNGIPPKSIKTVVGVMKAYETYVGNKYADPLMDEDLLRLQAEGDEFGATTGRPRRTNWLDLDKVIMAIDINGVDIVYINKFDILCTVGVYKLYHKGILHNFEHGDAFKKYISDTLSLETDVCGVMWHSSPFS